MGTKYFYRIVTGFAVILTLVATLGLFYTSADAEVLIDWSRLKDMPGGPRYGMASAVIGDNIYLFGGRGSGGNSLN